MINQATGLVTDQEIIDIIAGAMRRRVRYPTDEATQHNANAVLAALRERYAIVPRPEPPIGGYEHIVESGKKRYATVELPEPYDHDGDTRFPVPLCEKGYGGKPNDGYLRIEPGYVSCKGDRVPPRIATLGVPSPTTAENARALAAALLAAANKAEEGK